MNTMLPVVCLLPNESTCLNLLHPQLSNSGKKDSTVMENEPMDEDMDVSRTQTDNQEEIDLFEDGDGPHHSTSRPNQHNEEAGDSKFSTGNAFK